MLRIGLYGVGGLYNFGCEAIIRGTIRYIQLKYGENVKITYYSKNYEYDSNILNDESIEVVNIERKVTTIKKVVIKSVEILNIKYIPFKRKEYITVIDNSDIIFSIGGDLYTIHKHLMSHKKYRFMNNMVEFGKLAIKKNKELYIFGASIGPFGNYGQANDYFRKHLKKVNGIFCREYRTVEYLNSLGIHENVFFCPDPSFLVDARYKSNANNNHTIGINFSPWSLQELYDNFTDIDYDYFIRILRIVIEKINRDILLIPHVISPYKNDNDYLLIKKLFDQLPDEMKKRVRIADFSKGYLGIKSEISGCDLIITARMHCGLNAIHENVPTIFISYSQKSVGMCEYVYEAKKFVVSFEELEKFISENIVSIFNEKDAISEKLKLRNANIMNDFSVNLDKIRGSEYCG